MNGLRLLVRTIDSVSVSIGRLTSYTMLILLVTSSIEIVSRYFFNNPTTWAYEFGQMTFGCYFLLAGAMTLKDREHVGMDIFIEKLSPRKRAWVNCATFGFTALFCIILIWKGWEFAYPSIQKLEHSTSVWGPPIYPYKFMLPFGCFLLFAQAISNFIKDFYFALSGNHLDHGEE
ncbi:MAG: TRAP transporter small permease subunit [Desulfobacteraceae bacterium]|nr:TRAP transporter small permease subunit [Desulfobacteraceae bacterium]